MQVQVDTIPEQKHFDGVSFPLVLKPTTFDSTLSDLTNYIKEHLNEIESQLYKHGAILFRGFSVLTAHDMDEVFKSFGKPDLYYVGGAAPRSVVVGAVHTTNESPPEINIPFHHEMAQVPVYPQRLFFYCENPATKGGATPICLSNLVYEKMKQERPEFVNNLEQKGLIYTRIIPEDDDHESALGRGWKSTFQTQDKDVAIQRAAELGVSMHWLENGDVKTVTGVIPGVKYYEKTGKKVWFNSLVAAYTGWKDKRNDPVKAVTFGDGTPLDDEAVHKCVEILRENCVAFSWQKGDVLYIDNNAVLHSRQSYEGPRRILACLGKDA
jgi:hypothetical protein